jgi:hypothetical protein
MRHRLVPDPTGNSAAPVPPRRSIGAGPDGPTACRRSEAVVNTRREGKNIFYSVADPALLEILAVLYRLYCPKEK